MNEINLIWLINSNPELFILLMFVIFIVFSIFLNIVIKKYKKNNNIQNNEILPFDNKTFQYLWWEYAKDINYVYHEWYVIKNVDISSFQFLWWDYAKDINNVYYYWDIVEKTDISSFKYIWWDYAKDINNIYHYWNIVTKKTNFIHLWWNYVEYEWKIRCDLH